MSALHSDALTFFGATGDLVYRKICPSLYAMERRGHLQVPVIGIARSAWTIEQFWARARERIEKHGALDDAVFAKLAERLHYISGDYGAPATHAALRKELGGAAHPLHYLAIPPSVFASVVEALGQSGCAAVRALSWRSPSAVTSLPRRRSARRSTRSSTSRTSSASTTTLARNR